MSDHSAVMIDDLTIRYRSRAAVNQLSLSVASGEIFGLLGPNGSGKSSMLAAIAGLLEPAIGSIRVDGLARRESPMEYARRIGYVPQQPALYDELSATDNLDFFASLYDYRRSERRRRVAWALERVELTNRDRDLVSTFSGGMKQRLNVAAAFLHEPTVLLLDEPTVALDSNSKEILFRLLGDWRDQGRTVILATHHLDEAEQWCDRIGILNEGRLEHLGRPRQVLHPENRRGLRILPLSDDEDEESVPTVRRAA